MSSYLEIAHYGNLDYNYLGYTTFGVIITILSPSYYSEATIGTRGWTNYNLGEIKHFLVHTKIGVYSSFTNIRKFVK